MSSSKAQVCMLTGDAKVSNKMQPVKGEFQKAATPFVASSICSNFKALPCGVAQRAAKQVLASPLSIPSGVAN